MLSNTGNNDKREPGRLKDKVKISSDFDKTSQEFIDDFEGVANTSTERSEVAGSRENPSVATRHLPLSGED